jgi:putative heme-binding domain-containing protein
LAAEELAGVLRKYPAGVQQAADPLLARLGLDLAGQQMRLAELSPLTEGGNAHAGRAVFFGRKAACATCHVIDGQGGRFGPELSKIGASRTGRDLLEAIVYPSASFVNGYRPQVAALKNGKIVQGVVVAESGEALTFRTQQLQEVRVPRADIEELQESNVSIMPRGLDTQLSREELRNLLAYLQSRR